MLFGIEPAHYLIDAFTPDNHFDRIGCVLPALFHKLLLFCGEMSENMIRKIPSLRLFTDTNSDTDKFLRSSLAIMSFNPL